MKRKKIIFLVFLLLVSVLPAQAEIKTFIKEYTYQASEDDSRNSSRTLALREVKRLLLEELGTYLESVTEVQNFRLTKDRITALTAGIVQTEIMADKWDGDSLKYWLKAKIAVDSNELIKSIDALHNDRAKTKELEDVKRRSDDLLRENQRLRKELSVASVEQKPKEIAAYNKTIRDLSDIDWEERAYALSLSAISRNKQKEVINTFNEVIKLNPQNAKAYYYRGLAYANIGNNQQAITDYNKAIEIDPKYIAAYGDRGNTYADLGNYRQAIKDNNKIIELDPRNVEAYFYRGIAYGKLGNSDQAIKDYDSAIKINPKDANSYGYRGMAYANIGKYRQAIKDYNKVTELNAQYNGFFYGGNIYYFRGIAHEKLGNYQLAINDLTKAIRSGALIGEGNLFATASYYRGIAYSKLGDHQSAVEDLKFAASQGLKEAQTYLRKRGIKW